MDTTAMPEPLDEPEETLTNREQTAQRALRGAVLGLLFFSLQFDVFWLLVCVFVSDEPLSPKPLRAALLAAGICLPMTMLMCLFLNIMLAPLAR
jgi:hypothetical protein